MNPECRIVYVGERGGKFQSLVDEHSAIDEVQTIFAGKFRRYNGDSWLSRLLDVKTLLLNIRDGFFVLLGMLQAVGVVRRVKPDVVFLKGGFVGVPIGFAAAIKKVPFVTHDSDAIPGLANRIVGRWATLHTTGMPTEFYAYPKQKTRYVGVLVSDKYHYVDETEKAAYRRDLQLPEQGRVLLLTGGSLGAQRLNAAFGQVVPALLQQFSDLLIIHQVGLGNLKQLDDVNDARYHKLEFMDGMYRYTGAADVVVTRAGANTLAELGVQGKACVVVPNPQLTGGHQLKNTEYLLQHHAIVTVDERAFKKTDAHELQAAAAKLLEYPVMRAELAQTLRSLTKDNAVQELAAQLLQLGKKLAG